MRLTTHFERLTVKDVHRNSLTELSVIVENTGNIEANITDVFINDKPVNSMNGIISSPEMPFVLKIGEVRTVILSFSTPLSSNVDYKVSIHTEIGSNYIRTVTLP